MMTHHAALIGAMVMVAGSDSDMDADEMRTIGNLVRTLPVFEDYDENELTNDARACAEMLQQEDGLRKTLGAIAAALPGRLRETAYVCACDVAAADGHVPETEARMLELIRQHLRLGRLVTAAIERAARARHMTSAEG